MSNPPIEVYWKNQYVFDKLMTLMRKLESDFVTDVVDALMNSAQPIFQVKYLSPEGAGDGTLRFIPSEWQDRVWEANGMTAPLSSQIHYHVAFRNFKEDVEVKLYLPEVAERDTQLVLMDAFLKQSDKMHDNSLGKSCITAKSDAITKFLELQGRTIKLYSMSIPWKAVGNRYEIALNSGQLATFGAAVKRHTEVIESIAPLRA